MAKVIEATPCLKGKEVTNVLKRMKAKEKAGLYKEDERFLLLIAEFNLAKWNCKPDKPNLF